MLVPVFFVLLASSVSATLPPSCDSEVYCTGPLLHTVQMARIFNDSKTFVDLKQIHEENITLSNFQKLMHDNNQNPSVEKIEQFVKENFEAGNEFEEWIPSDFVAEPKVLAKIQDKNLREFAKELVKLWKTLARKMKPDVSKNQNQYSLIPLPNGFIIPGGRFKEIYYWDTYWIIRGLLISEMTETARGIIENFMHLVKTLGHVPNGSRVYYTQRSQPPLLTKMVAQYMNYTNDLEWLSKNINTLDDELQYWIKNRQVKITLNAITYKLYQYNAPSNGPRPESYREDVLTANTTSNPNETYVQLKSGAESGWDFSSRWMFDKNGGNNANLTNIHVTRIIPVDLNAFLYDAFNTLSQLYRSLGNYIKAKEWKNRAKALDQAINLVLWNEKAGVWQDFDMQLKKHRDYFYVSNLAPLWVKSGDTIKANRAIKPILKYLKNEGIEKYPGGTPTSMNQSGEQWDLPNCWAPLQAILVQGLAQSNDRDAMNLAEKLAHLWVRANYIGFKETKEMFEKYDANVPGQFGGGGEYTVQAGFGWTNGVALEFLETYANTLTVS